MVTPCSPDGDPVVLNPIPGYDYALINTPGYGQTAVIGIGLYPGSETVVVRFQPDVTGPTVINLTSPDVEAYP